MASLEGHVGWRDRRWKSVVGGRGPGESMMVRSRGQATARVGSGCGVLVGGKNMSIGGTSFGRLGVAASIAGCSSKQMTKGVAIA